ncbi:MAG: hypothetical protein AB7G39_05000 [Alphaproteobacteria bacterium]
MSEPNIEELLDRMLSSGKLSEEAAAELREFREELTQDRLDPSDAAYVEALARRLGFLGDGATSATLDAVPAEDDDAQAAAPNRAAMALAAVRSAVDDLCHPDRLAADDPDREAKTRLHAALAVRLDGIARDFA